MTPTIFDVGILLVLALYAVLGYRRGLLLTVLSTVGFLVGGALGLMFLPGLVAQYSPIQDGIGRPLVLVVLLLLAATLGQHLVSRLGWGAHRTLNRTPLGVVNALLGSVLTTAAALATVWFAAGVLRHASPNALGQAITRSQVLATVDEAMPRSSEQVIGRVLVVLDRYGVPRVFDGVTAEPITPVEPVQDSAVATRGVRAAAESVLRIDALAPGCRRSQEGSGWVAEEGLVVTNAHVVAGARQVTVTGKQGRLQADVVAFDPQRDLAVLSVPELSAPALRLGGDLSHGDAAAAAGFPMGGPYRVDAARVRGMLSARGDDIYGRSRVVRQVYSLRVDIRPGNSGGPLLSPDGSVSGVVFARSLDDDDTGYALTLEEVRPVLADATARGEVGTGECAA